MAHGLKRHHNRSLLLLKCAVGKHGLILLVGPGHSLQHGAASCVRDTAPGTSVTAETLLTADLWHTWHYALEVSLTELPLPVLPLAVFTMQSIIERLLRRIGSATGPAGG